MKNVGIVKLLLFAGIVTLIGVSLKSGTGGSEGKTASLLAEKNRDRVKHQFAFNKKWPHGFVIQNP